MELTSNQLHTLRHMLKQIHDTEVEADRIEYSYTETATPETREKPSKNCIFCGESHYHNNAFCSTKCANGYWREQTEKEEPCK